MRALARIALASAAAACAAGCSSVTTPTQVIVLVNAEEEVRSAAALVHLIVSDGDGDAALDEVVVPSWPIKLALAPKDGDPSRTYTVTAEAIDDAGAVLTRARVASGYVEGEKRFVVLLLEAACLGISCTRANDTCHAARCLLAEVRPEQLGKLRTEAPDVGSLVGSAGDDGGAAGIGGEADASADGGATVDGGASGRGGTDGKAGAGGKNGAAGQGGTAASAECDAPTAPEHGSVSVSAGVASYACDAGYVLAGDDERTCEADQSWSGSQPACMDFDACADAPVCTADFPCRDRPAPSLEYSCRGQYAEWKPSDAPASFSANTDGTVTDERSQLVWQESVDGGTYTWDSAKAYCEDLTLAGHRDWRLPARAELESLIDFTRYGSSIDPDVFPDTPDDWFWSSSPYAGEAGSAWTVVFDNGNSFYTETSRPSRVRCVRGAEPVSSSSGSGGAPPGRYEVSADGTVEDLRTTLTWQRVPDADMFTQVDAETHCEGLTLAGGGFRLPSISELLSLVDPTRADPAIDPAAFPGRPSDVFWTSTAHASVVNEAWNIYFFYGYSSSSDTAMQGRARCVR